MRGYVYTYSPSAKEKIKRCLERFLEQAKAIQYTDNILTILDELIKNGIKGNYKYVFVIEKIGQYLYDNPKRDNPSLADILRSPSLYNEVVSHNLKFDDVEPKIRQILDEEAQSIRLRLRAVNEQRKFTDEEKNALRGYQALIRAKKKVRIYGLNMQITMHEDNNMLMLEVINSAPILTSDLKRIQDKRAAFKDYASRGEEAMFFIDNMETGGAGSGLGYGTIDASLIDMGLDPQESLTIISAANTTALLSIDYHQLKRD